MDQVAEIKQKLNIVDIVGGYVPLKKAGKNYKGNCPFHTEKTPSFMVSPEIQIYKCFGCGETGDVFSFMQKMEGFEFPQALELLAEKAGVTLKRQHFDKNASLKKLIYEINHLTMLFYHQILLKHPSGKKALDYLTVKRGLSLDTIKEFRLGYTPESWDLLIRFLRKRKYSISDMLAAGVITPRSSGKGHIDKFRNRIIFPFEDVSRKIVGFSGRSLSDRGPKYLNTSETLVFRKSYFLYGLAKTKTGIKKEGALFVEGPTDVLSAYQHGIKNAVASSGTSLTLGQLDLVSRYTKDVIFCFDSDEAGLTAAKRATGLAEQKGFNIRVALLPPEFKDLDELAQKNSAKAKKVVEKAVPIYDFFLMLVLKKYAKKGPIEKRKIVEELTPDFAKISDRVMLDHYVKKLSKEIDIREEVLTSIFSGAATPDTFTASFGQQLSSVGSSNFLKSKEAYVLALLFKADIDILRKFLYKLVRKDFSHSSPVLKKVFGEFKRYVKDLSERVKVFNIKKFTDTIEADLQSVVQELYLWDVGEVTNTPELLTKELAAVVTSLKKSSARREIEFLSEELKLAEMANNSREVKALTEKIKKFTKELI